MPTKYVDWQQIILNGGPPCFYVEGDRYCCRAQRWFGHTNEPVSEFDHKFVSFNDLLAAVRKNERRSCAKLAEMMSAGETGSARLKALNIAAAIRSMDEN